MLSGGSTLLPSPTSRLSCTYQNTLDGQIPGCRRRNSRSGGDITLLVCRVLGLPSNKYGRRRPGSYSVQTHHDWVLPQSPGSQASLGVYSHGLCPLLHPDSTETKAHVASLSQHLRRLGQEFPVAIRTMASFSDMGPRR